MILLCITQIAQPPLAEPFHTVVDGTQFVSYMSRYVSTTAYLPVFLELQICV